MNNIKTDHFNTRLNERNKPTVFSLYDLDENKKQKYQNIENNKIYNLFNEQIKKWKKSKKPITKNIDKPSKKNKGGFTGIVYKSENKHGVCYVMKTCGHKFTFTLKLGIICLITYGEITNGK